MGAPAALQLSNKATSGCKTASGFASKDIYEMTGCSVNLWLASEHASSAAARRSLRKPFAAVRAGRRLGRSRRSACLPVGFASNNLHGPCSPTPALPVPISWRRGAGAGAARAWAFPAVGADPQAPCALPLMALQQQRPKHDSPLDFLSPA